MKGLTVRRQGQRGALSRIDVCGVHSVAVDFVDIGRIMDDNGGI